MRFTIRDLFLVTMILAMGLGWWVDRSQLIWSEAQTAKSLRDRLDKADPGWQDRSVPTNHGLTVKPQLPPAVGLFSFLEQPFCLLFSFGNERCILPCLKTIVDSKRRPALD